MLSGRSQSQKSTECIFSFIWLSRIDKIIMTRKKSAGIQGVDLTAKAHKGTFWNNRNILYLNCGSGYTMLHTCKKFSNFTHKIGKFLKITSFIFSFTQYFVTVSNVYILSLLYWAMDSKNVFWWISELSHHELLWSLWHVKG